MKSFLNIQNLRRARRWRLCVSAWVSVSLLFLSISTPIHAQPAPDCVGQPVPIPAGEGSVSAKRDATIGDVAVCTMLAEGVAILIWYLPAALRALGAGANAANTKLVAILGGDKNLVTGIEMIAAAIGLKIMPKKWMEMTLQEFFNQVIKPAWDSCKRVGADLGTLPGSLATILQEPQFYIPSPTDSLGVRTGRYCADINRGWFSQGYAGCVKCCEGHLMDNQLLRYRSGCYAVCNAQFDPSNCVSVCTGRTCGPNGCGGSCGKCASSQMCSVSGQCQAKPCTPSCTGKTCGPNGCGGTCGSCASNQMCNASGQCQAKPCTPSCTGKTCGSNGCGGTCGTCRINEACFGGKCQIGDNPVPVF